MEIMVPYINEIPFVFSYSDRVMKNFRDFREVSNNDGNRNDYFISLLVAISHEVGLAKDLDIIDISKAFSINENV